MGVLGVRREALQLSQSELVSQIARDFGSEPDGAESGETHLRFDWSFLANTQFPKIYVYNLGNLKNHFKTEHCENVQKEDDKDECLFGKEIHINFKQAERDAMLLTLHDCDQYAISRILYSRILHYEGNIDKPEEADILFIPEFWKEGPGEPGGHPDFDDYCMQKKGQPENLLRNLPYLDRDSSYRHMQIIPRPHPKCKFQMLDGQSPKINDILSNVLRLGLENYEGITSIPYPTIAAGLKPTQLDAVIRTSWRSKRMLLAFGTFGLHQNRNNSLLRHHLRELCIKDSQCRYLPVDYDQHDTPEYKKWFNNMITMSLMSEFCLQPSGDTVSRKGILDSMTLGCIPVFFDAEQQNLWRWHIPNWKDVSILVPMKRPEVVMNVLKAISKNEIRLKRRNILKLIPSISILAPQTGTTDKRVQKRTQFDAIDITLLKSFEAVKKFHETKLTKNQVNMGRN
ncbi:hypothetical protein AAMO2058_001013700 [Amorphochlora amoebiformis]